MNNNTFRVSHLGRVGDFKGSKALQKIAPIQEIPETSPESTIEANINYRTKKVRFRDVFELSVLELSGDPDELQHYLSEQLEFVFN